MKKRAKVVIGTIAAIALVAAGFAVWWFTPTHFLNRVDPAEIVNIEVFNGNDGNRFNITDTEEIKFIAEHIQTVSMKKNRISAGMGTTYNLRFLDSNGKEIDEFIIMDMTSIKSGLVFYKCGGQLQQVEEYLIELEKAQFPDTEWLKYQTNNAD